MKITFCDLTEEELESLTNSEGEFSEEPDRCNDSNCFDCYGDNLR